MKPKTNTNTKEGQEKYTTVTEINMGYLFRQHHQNKHPVTFVLVMLSNEPAVEYVTASSFSIYIISFV